MGVELGSVVGGGAKVGGFFFSPLGRANLLIAGVIFFCMVMVGVFESAEQHSLYPLFDRTIFKVVGADFQIGRDVDLLESADRPHFSSVLSKSFPAYLWFWVKFWFSVISNLWFIYFFCWLIYGFWYMMNNSLILRNIIFSIISFLLISVFIGMIFFNLSLAGSCVPDDKQVLFSKQMSNVYPLHGVVKLVSHFVTRDLFYRVDRFASSPFGEVMSNIPLDNNTMVVLNDSA